MRCKLSFFFFFKSFKDFIYLLLLAVPSLRCCRGFSLVVLSGDYSLVAVRGLLLLQTTGPREFQYVRLSGSRAKAQ